MDRKTFDHTLGTFKNFRPFHPFTIELMNGTKVEVDHPDAIVVRNGAGVFVGPEGVPSIFYCDGVTQVVGDFAHRLE